MPASLTDQLNHVNRDQLCHDSYRLIDTLQNFERGSQIASLAVVFLQMCEVFGLDVRRELERADRITHDQDKQHLPQFKAIRSYIEGELL